MATPQIAAHLEGRRGKEHANCHKLELLTNADEVLQKHLRSVFVVELTAGTTLAKKLSGALAA